MIRPRRVHALLLVPVLVPVLLAGCGDVVDGTGAPASGSRSVDFPSGSASAPDPSGSGPASSSVPSASASSSSASSSTGPNGTLTSLTGYATSVRLDPAFVSALGALKVTPGLVGTAKLSGSSLSLPVTGGAITVSTSGGSTRVSGSADHDGSGLTLTAGSTTISLTGLRFEFGTTSQVSGMVLANGKLAASRTTLFTLDTASARVFGDTRVITIGGVNVKVGDGLAVLLNKAFATTGFASSLVVGSAISTFTGAR